MSCLASSSPWELIGQTGWTPACCRDAHGQHLLLCLLFNPFMDPASFLMPNSSATWRSESVSVFLPSASFPRPSRRPPILFLLHSTAIRCPLQQLSRWSAFYTVRLQCTRPISLWSEAGLNMSILILPNKLNHAAGCRGEGECWGCWEGGEGVGWVGGQAAEGGCQPEPLSVRSDQDILKGESLIGSGRWDELVGEGR